MEAETLNAFLAPLSVLPLALCRVRDALVKLGYDDVDDYANYDDAALQRLRDNMATECIPPAATRTKLSVPSTSCARRRR